ncbi:MAG: GNAT family N-acetyltransferase [Desulfobacterales bacterium]|jgi:ribosomal protein S18 acetylase RimI-like enzyme
MEIKRAQTDNEMAEVRRLFRAYESALGVDLTFQGFDQELASLPGKYAPPTGDLLVGRVQGRILGCVAVRRLEGDICEMKRLYVRPEGRGAGLGRRLAQRIIVAARSLGYASMRLDTLDRLTGAMRLYESLGFRRIDPYYGNPLPGVVYWELDLKPAGPQ